MWKCEDEVIKRNQPFQNQTETFLSRSHIIFGRKYSVLPTDAYLN